MTGEFRLLIGAGLPASFSLASGYAAAASGEGRSGELWLWLYTLPDWVVLGVVVGTFTVLSLLGLAGYRRYVKQPREAGRGTYSQRTAGYVAAAGAIAGIAVALLFADAWKAHVFQVISEMPPSAAGRPQIPPGIRGQDLTPPLLDELLDKNPAEALRLLLPEDARVLLPPDTQSLIEGQRELEGTLQVLHVDYKDAGKNHYVHLLETNRGEHYSLHFATQLPKVLSGTKVKAKGLLLHGAKPRDTGETEGALLLESADTGLQILEAGGSGSTTTTTTTSASTVSALPNTLGEQKTLVILVNFQDNPTQPYLPTDAQNLVFGTASSFYLENSYQQTWLSGDVAGWFTIALSSTVCDPSTLASQAQAAASAAGVNLSSYAHQVYAFPKNACGGTGLGTVGGNPSQAWIIGSLTLSAVAHELGHNLGLYHAHALECGTAVLGTGCTSMEYGDPFDTMGNSNSGHFSAVQKERLGWLNSGGSPPITSVLSDGTYTLESYELGGSAPKALKILKSTDPTTGAKTWYYIESRQAAGFDGFLSSNANVLNGVLVHTGSLGDAYLLDMTPGSGSLNYLDWLDPALGTGKSFDDPNAGVTVTAEWVTATAAAVTVSFGAAGTTQTNSLTVAIFTDQASYSRGQTVSATATVTSAGAPVANATVAFAITKANGSTVTAMVTTGANGAAVYKLKLGKRDPLGTYQAAATATNNGTSGSAATTFKVQ